MTNDVATILAEAAVWNISGLSITLIGVFLLYRFGMPFRVRRKPGEVTLDFGGA
jgi:hypothetical protein